MSARRLLIISHEAGRTGAPLSALTLAREFSRSGAELKIILRRDGPLRSDFEALGATYIFRSEPSFSLADMPSMALRTDPILALKCLRNPDRPYCLSRAEEIQTRDLAATVMAWAPDAVYANTTHCGDVLDALNGLDAPVLMHVRELGETLKALDARRRGAVVRHADHAVCVSQRVARELTDEFPALQGRTSIEPPAVASMASDEEPPSLALANMGAEDIIILGVGTVGPRKGADLFIEAAKHALLRWPGAGALRFIWLGNGPERENYVRQLAAEGFEERIMFPGETDNPFAFYRAAHALLCTSREDPYPRIMIEAGGCGVPVVAFEGAGGSDDFITNYDAGERVAFGNAAAMGDALVGLLGKGRNIGVVEALAERVRKGHAPEASAQRLLRIIEDMIARGKRA